VAKKAVREVLKATAGCSAELRHDIKDDREHGAERQDRSDGAEEDP
jgi:hypothetical protein